MDIITIIQNMEKEAFKDKDLYLVSRIKFQNGNWVVNGEPDAAALAENPSPIILQFVEEVGLDRSWLLIALTDWSDVNKVAEVKIPKRAPKLACIPIRFDRNIREEVKTIDEIIGFSESNLLFRDKLIGETLGEVPSLWSVQGDCVVREKFGKKQIQINDLDSNNQVFVSKDISGDADIINIHAFLTSGQTDKEGGITLKNNNDDIIAQIYFGFEEIEGIFYGKIYLKTGSSEEIIEINYLGSYEINKEYSFRIELNQVIEKISVWINGDLKVSDIDTCIPIVEEP